MGKRGGLGRISLPLGRGMVDNDEALNNVSDLRVKNTFRQEISETELLNASAYRTSEFNALAKESKIKLAFILSPYIRQAMR